MKCPHPPLTAPLLLLGLLFLCTAQAPKPRTLEQTLRESRWQKRVLLVAASNAAQADFQKQKALLATNHRELAARDFLVLDVLYDQLTAADKLFLTQKTGIKPPGFAAIFIGKDGGVKQQSRRPLAPADLFGLVDKMPMRREEMRRAK